MRRSGMSPVTCALVLVAGFGCANEALAVLGGAEETVQADHRRFGGERRQAAGSQFRTHEVSLPDGSTVKQYVNASGVVFAVSWRTRLKPDLNALLGSGYAALAVGSVAGAGVASARMQQLTRQPHLVVHQGGRMNAFAGLAYVPTLVPQGFNADALR
ncbi:MAG: DUF2844 domain-containing protein [Comamonadaceae bacterium]